MNRSTIKERPIIKNRFFVPKSFKKKHIKGSLNCSIKKLQTNCKKFSNIIDSLPDATFVIDNNGVVIAWNNAIEEMTGVKKEDIIGKGEYVYAVPFYGKPRPILADLIIKPDRAVESSYEVFVREGDELKSEGYVPGAYKNKGAYLWSKASPLYEENRIIGAIQAIRDITDKKNLEMQLKNYGLYDFLTGLCNRTYFEEEARRAECGRHKSVGLILCDVDGLKLVNDTMGHAAGDNVLVTAANIVKSSFRKSDIVARIGGDEFAILIPDVTEKALEGMINRIKDAIDKYNTNNKEIPISLSIGYAYSEDSVICLKELFKKADYNMYLEKTRKRNISKNVIIKRFIDILETKDFINDGHADRLKVLVTDMALAISLPAHKIDDLRLLAQYHDIGKIGVTNNIIFKPGDLTPDEYNKMRRHCEIGHYIAISSSDLAVIADLILKHHEWWNGEGYPLGLKGDEIPIECLIFAIADAFDAMTSKRPYRKIVSYQEALDEIKKYAGTQFSPYLADTFIELIKNKYHLPTNHHLTTA